MEVEDLRKVTKAKFSGTKAEFDKVKDRYDGIDVVYGEISRNAGNYYHIIPIYKRPSGLTDWEVAYVVDGFFFDVINRGGDLECWFD